VFRPRPSVVAFAVARQINDFMGIQMWYVFVKDTVFIFANGWLLLKGFFVVEWRYSQIFVTVVDSAERFPVCIGFKVRTVSFELP
jgi:hypothetical protein